MNRILFERSEIVDGVVTFGGERAEHVLNVLHGEVGQVLKTGEIDGRIGTSTIQSIDTTGPARISVAVSHREESLRPWVDLVLAPPRPRVMKRLLPQLATLGVGKIVLVGAEKVEKDFWGATLLKPENYRPLLIDGLMQAGTSILPTIELRRNFRKFVREELDTMLPSPNRIVAHPYETKDARPETGDRSQSTNRPIEQFFPDPRHRAGGGLDRRGDLAFRGTWLLPLFAWLPYSPHRHGDNRASGAADAEIRCGLILSARYVLCLYGKECG